MMMTFFKKLSVCPCVSLCVSTCPSVSREFHQRNQGYAYRKISSIVTEGSTMHKKNNSKNDLDWVKIPSEYTHSASGLAIAGAVEHLADLCPESLLPAEAWQALNDLQHRICGAECRLCARIHRVADKIAAFDKSIKALTKDAQEGLAINARAELQRSRKVALEAHSELLRMRKVTNGCDICDVGKDTDTIEALTQQYGGTHV